MNLTLKTPRSSQKYGCDSSNAAWKRIPHPRNFFYYRVYIYLYSAERHFQQLTLYEVEC
jgi:hypothetical protein